MNVTGGQLQVQVSLVTRSTDLEVSWGAGKERAEGGLRLQIQFELSRFKCLWHNKTLLWVLGLHKRGGCEFETLQAVLVSTFSNQYALHYGQVWGLIWKKHQFLLLVSQSEAGYG